MEVTEFRIGNYLQATHEVTISRGNGIEEDIETLIILIIRGIDLDSQLIDGSCTFSLEEVDTNYELDRYNDLEPIPLTEEWLIKFEFEDNNDWTYNKNRLKFDINTIGKVRFHYSGKVAYLDYVHQLQNLYYSLTGTELSLAKNKTETNNANEMES